MKTAVSLPDDLFQAVERLAKKSHRKRSEVYAAALREYLARHSPDEVTEALNRVIEEIDPAEMEEDVQFLHAAARRVFENTEW
jgi:metal-responsive CopG/Arc/MetJ family transcriptional regulator